MAYVWAKCLKSKFRNPGFADIYRTDYSVEMEYHWARCFDTRLQFSSYDYENRDGFYGGGISAKLSPRPSFDIYATYLHNHPFVSSITTVYSGMRQNSIGIGVDARSYGKWSTQGSLEMARVNDGNHWLNFKPQVSWRLMERPESYVRLGYELLTYAEEKPEYWTPEDWQLLGPKVDVYHDIADWLSIEAAVETPYVFDRSQFGVQLTMGIESEFYRQLRAGAAYTYGSFPGDQGHWTGHGWEVFISWRF
jgi:hypothetical protein